MELKPLNIKHLTFKDFQELNAKRCSEAYHKVDENAWPIQNWCLAIAGESGELCNLVKKVIRGDFPLEQVKKEILDELADVIIYCDLAITHLREDTAEVIMDKFDKTSEKIGWSNK